MVIFQALLIGFLGGCLLVVTWRSLRLGWLPCGANGFKGTLKFWKDKQPFGYWLMFVVYSVGGVWAVIFALRLLAGQVEPLPLR
ncbi:MAG: hypothetical protein WCZ65_04165 [Lysobacteraceae bacterium]